MPLATINSSFEQPGKAGLYLVAYPTGGYAGANLAAKTTDLFAKFYSSGSQRAGAPTVAKFCNLMAEGVSVKIKQNVADVDLNDESKRPSFIQDFEASVEFSFMDLDVAHLAALMSGLSSDITSTAAAASTAGRDTLNYGNQVILTKYALMIRSISGNNITNFAGTAYENDHIIFPKVVCQFDSDIKMSKKEPNSGKAKFTCLYDSSIVDAFGNPVLGFRDTVTAKATA